jgi:hypothetical protein
LRYESGSPAKIEYSSWRASMPIATLSGEENELIATLRTPDRFSTSCS